MAKQQQIKLWDFRDLLRQMADANRDHKAYFTDDTCVLFSFLLWLIIIGSLRRPKLVKSCQYTTTDSKIRISQGLRSDKRLSETGPRRST